MDTEASGEDLLHQHAPIRAATIDLNTGEILEGTPILRRPIIKNFKKEYMIMFLEAFDKIAMDKTWKQEETRIFHFILSRTAMGNWLQMTQTEIGNQLGINQGNVSKNFKSLTARGVLESTIRVGKSKAYRISLDVGWRGAGGAYTKEKKARQTARDKGWQTIIGGKE